MQSNSSPLQDKYDDPRQSQMSLDFQKFIKETLFESRILEGMEQEIITEKNDDINPNIPSDIEPFVVIIKALSTELSSLFGHFQVLADKSMDVRRLKDLFEASLNEYSLRDKEIHKLLNSILDKDQGYRQQINSLQIKQRQLEHELSKLQKQHDIRNQRQAGQYKANPTNYIDFKQDDLIDETSLYDWIVDIDLMTSIAGGGWKVHLSPKFMDQQIFDVEQLMPSSIKKIHQDGATVAVTGLYDKGKTFVLNNLTLSNLPSGKKVNTKGISFKHVNVDGGTNLIIVDTAGSYSPVIIENEFSIVEKEATEMFILDLVFDIADYFICVVNDFTSLDQRYLDRLSRNLQVSPSKSFREIIVIHNFKDVEAPDILEHVWANQVTQIYQHGTLQRTRVAAINPQYHNLQERNVLWFKTQFTRHVCLVNDDSQLGTNINPWVFSLLRYWLKAVFVPVNRPISVVESLLNFSKTKLSSYFRNDISLNLYDTHDPFIKVIKSNSQVEENVRIPQVSIDSSGLIMARPDSFLPSTDIIAGDRYIIYMDVPGIKEEDIEIYRQNVITIVKGWRKCPYSEVKKLERNERKYGEFTITFKIPEIYERKWSHFEVLDGVIAIIYEKDNDEQQQT